MWYNREHENSHFYSSVKRRRTAPDPGRITFVGSLCVARCQILAASARGERVPMIARQLGCDDQTVRNVIHHFNAEGLAILQEGSSRPHRLRTSFSPEGLQQLKDLLHRSPRDFGKERSAWTLELAAQVSFEQGITATLVSDESMRRALKRLKTHWKRAKHWITSPNRQYLLKKTPATG